MLRIRNDFLRLRLFKGSGCNRIRLRPQVFKKHVRKISRKFLISYNKKGRSNQQCTVLSVQVKQKRRKIVMVFCFYFYLDPDSKQIVPDPGKRSGSNRIWVHNTAFCREVFKMTYRFYMVGFFFSGLLKT